MDLIFSRKLTGRFGIATFSGARLGRSASVPAIPSIEDVHNEALDPYKRDGSYSLRKTGINTPLEVDDLLFTW